MVFEASILEVPFHSLFNNFFLALFPLFETLIQRPFLARLVHLEDLLD